MKVLAIALSFLLVTGLAVHAGTKSTAFAHANGHESLFCIAHNIGNADADVLVQLKDTNGQILSSSQTQLHGGQWFSVTSDYNVSGFCSVTTDSKNVRGYLWEYDTNLDTVNVILETH